MQQRFQRCFTGILVTLFGMLLCGWHAAAADTTVPLVIEIPVICGAVPGQTAASYHIQCKDASQVVLQECLQSPGSTARISLPVTEPGDYLYTLSEAADAEGIHDTAVYTVQLHAEISAAGELSAAYTLQREGCQGKTEAAVFDKATANPAVTGHRAGTPVRTAVQPRSQKEAPRTGDTTMVPLAGLTGASLLVSIASRRRTGNHKAQQEDSSL